MKISLLTAGSRGDTQPFVALGVALEKLGVQVTVAAGENFKHLVTEHGLRYSQVRIDIDKVLASGQVDDAMKAAGPIKMLRSIDRPEFMSVFLKLQQDYAQACQGADAVVFHPGASVAHFLARERGIPAFLGAPFPMTSSAEYPAILLYGRKIPRFLNRLTHRLFYQGFWMAIRKPIALYFKNLDGQKRSFENPFLHDGNKLISCSNRIFKTSEPAFCKGYWFLDEGDRYQAPADLVDFLQRGEKPIYVGFGSVGSHGEAAFKTRMVVEAVAECGCRALIATGAGGLDDAVEASDSIHFIREAPHAWLFPRVALVVHHGGAGTTAAGMRAGVPSLIIPHGNDQFAWGQRVHDLGVGARPIANKKLTSAALLAGIQEALQPEIVNAARTLGEQLRAEDGAADTARYIVDRVQQQPAAAPPGLSGPSTLGLGVLVLLLAPLLVPLIPGSLFFLIQAIRGVPLADSLEIVRALVDPLRPYARLATIASVVVTLLLLFRKYRSRLAALWHNKPR